MLRAHYALPTVNRRMKQTLVPLALSAVLLGGVAHADDSSHGHNRLRVHVNKSSETDLVTVVVGDFRRSPENNYLVGATFGHDLSDTLFGLPFPMTWHVGVQYFDEQGYQHNALGATAFIKANYRMRVPWTQKHIDLGLGEGLSYVDRIPMSEQRDFAKKGPGVHSEKLMNYVEWTIDVPLRQFHALEPLFRDSGLEDMSVGFIVWHRSSVFGMFADTKGGVNFMGFGVEAKF
jgi:hypothetical protein